MQRALYAAASVAKNALPGSWFAWLKQRVREHTGPPTVYMLRPTLDDLPPVDLPRGCRVSSIAEDGDADFVRVTRASLVPHADAAWYRARFASHPEFDPRNLLIIREGDEAVGVAAAWQTTWEGRPIGLIHNVAVDPSHRGRGLGRAGTLLALERLRERGFDRVLLSTDDHRIPALSLYVSLGFEPVIFGLVHRLRWRRILARARSRELPRSAG